MEKEKNVAILVWVSCSWKSSLQEILINEKGYVRPLNFTSRKPRTEDAYEVDEDWDFSWKERDEYIFCSKKQLLQKYSNWDLLEIVNYWGNLYGISNLLDESKNNVIVVDPSGRAQALSYLIKRGWNVKTYYLEITKELQEERLRNRWDSEEEIYKRKSDYDWFSPTPKCVRLNWAKPTQELVTIIENDFKD